jgi:hypothetical protein
LYHNHESNDSIVEALEKALKLVLPIMLTTPLEDLIAQSEREQERGLGAQEAFLSLLNNAPAALLESSLERHF